jgi:hypothetical protein
MTDYPGESHPRDGHIDLGEVRKSLDSFDTSPPLPVETPMSAQMMVGVPIEPSGSSGPPGTPPTDFDG